MHEMTPAEKARAKELVALLTGPIPCSRPGEEKHDRRPPLRVVLARRRFLRWLSPMSADELRQWERERSGDEYYAAQRSVVEARRWAEANLGDHFIGSAV